MMAQQGVEVSTKFHPECQHKFVQYRDRDLSIVSLVVAPERPNFHVFITVFAKKSLDKQPDLYIITLTVMVRSKSKQPEEAKVTALREQGALHPRPEVVEDEAFLSHEFFDARDLVQARYEMLRRHRVDERPVTEVAPCFGVSRQAFYKTKTAFEGQGIPGLLPRRRGPKAAHKCTEEILDFVDEWRSSPPPDAAGSVVEAIEQRFAVTINPRSIERALARRKKKRPTKPEAHR
jgi:transposase